MGLANSVTSCPSMPVYLWLLRAGPGHKLNQCVASRGDIVVVFEWPSPKRVETEFGFATDVDADDVGSVVPVGEVRSARISSRRVAALGHSSMASPKSLLSSSSS